jgi:hypothetical protein
MRRLQGVTLILLSVLGVSPAAALSRPISGDVRADTLSSGCTTPEQRQFDFWIGRWVVTDSAGRELGRSEITRVSGGCAILEHWEGADGVGGMSLNGYDPESGRWRQFWIGEGGLMLRLEGGLRGSSMVLSGRHRGRRGELMDRITWTPVAAGGVRQLWEMSADGGATWRQVFDGLYRVSGS